MSARPRFWTSGGTFWDHFARVWERCPSNSRTSGQADIQPGTLAVEGTGAGGLCPWPETETYPRAVAHEEGWSPVLRIVDAGHGIVTPARPVLRNVHSLQNHDALLSGHESRPHSVAVRIGVDRPAVTPTTRLDVDRIPSLAPRTAARSQPMRYFRMGQAAHARAPSCAGLSSPVLRLSGLSSQKGRSSSRTGRARPGAGGPQLAQSAAGWRSSRPVRLASAWHPAGPGSWPRSGKTPLMPERIPPRLPGSPAGAVSGRHAVSWRHLRRSPAGQPQGGFRGPSRRDRQGDGMGLERAAPMPAADTEGRGPDRCRASRGRQHPARHLSAAGTVRRRCRHGPGQPRRTSVTVTGAPVSEAASARRSAPDGRGPLPSCHHAALKKRREALTFGSKQRKTEVSRRRDR